MEEHDIYEDSIVYNRYDENFENLMAGLVRTTGEMIKKGIPLLGRVPTRLRLQLKFTIMGGLRVLDKIRRLNYNVLNFRPVLNKGDWAQIALKSIIGNRY